MDTPLLPVTVVGPVLRGRQIGRTIGFPTANLAGDDVDVPVGVYAATLTRRDGTTMPSAASVGVRPTVTDEGERLLEVHVLDRDEWLEMYGEEVVVELRHFIRCERRFGSLDELTSQISLDCDEVRRLLAGSPGS